MTTGNIATPTMSATYKFANGTVHTTTLTFNQWADLTQDSANIAIITAAIQTQANLNITSPGVFDPVWDSWWRKFQTDPNVSDVFIFSGNV